MAVLVAVPTMVPWPHQAALLSCGHAVLVNLGFFHAAPSDMLGTGLWCERCHRETLASRDECWGEILRLYPATVEPAQGGS